MPEKTVTFKIRRQASPSASSYWEEFSLPWKKQMNVIRYYNIFLSQVLCVNLSHM